MKPSSTQRSCLEVPFFALFSLALAACGGSSDTDGSTGGAAGSGAMGGAAGAGGGAGSGGSGGVAGGSGGFAAGGGCTYQDIAGKATITSIDPINGVCPDPQMPRYHFAANDAGLPPDSYDPAKFGFSAGFESISLPGGKGLPKSCLDPSGITLGAALSMTRRIIQTGSCTPVIDTLELDLSLCVSQCP